MNKIAMTLQVLYLLAQHFSWFFFHIKNLETKHQTIGWLEMLFLNHDKIPNDFRVISFSHVKINTLMTHCLCVKIRRRFSIGNPDCIKHF